MKPWFTPKLLGLHLTAVVLVLTCLWLGRWQLGVYEIRQAAERSSQESAAPVDIGKVWGPNAYFTSDQIDSHVVITGEFEPADQQVWVTGKDDGVWLVAPVMVQGKDLLVVRGWAPKPTDLPAVPAGEVTFDAVLQPSDDSGATGFDPAQRTIGAVRIPELLNVLDRPLWSGYAIATTQSVADPLKLAQVPDPKVAWTTGGQNLGYSLQWWVFAGFVVFMWWRMAKEAVAATE